MQIRQKLKHENSLPEMCQTSLKAARHKRTHAHLKSSIFVDTDTKSEKRPRDFDSRPKAKGLFAGYHSVHRTECVSASVALFLLRILPPVENKCSGQHSSILLLLIVIIILIIMFIHTSTANTYTQFPSWHFPAHSLVKLCCCGQKSPSGV